jgi:hypothetical protein
MGSLTPNKTLIYEQVNGVTYARESGADPSTRRAIGWEYDPISGHKIDYDKRTNDGRPLYEHIKEDKLWGEIRQASKTNSTLHKALERAKIIYHLSKDHGNNKT